ncbi:SLATT domain-containing protein [Streptomyces violaceusniger]
MPETSPPTEAERRQAISAELERLEESAMYSAQSQFEQAKRWRLINLWLGVPASGLAAIAGAMALVTAAGRVIAGLVALTAAVLGAILTTINASHRMNQAASAANAYLEIQTAARQARDIDLPAWTVEEARSALAELTARGDEQNKTAEPPSRRAYLRGKANIDGGGQTYAIDASANQPEGH